MSKSPLTFRIFYGGNFVRQETLALGVIKLGKVPSAHLRLDDESVSRMHAIIEVEPTGAIQLIDLGSTRGTFVNGAKINKATIADGDVITLGDTRIELAVAAAAAVAVRSPPLPLPLPLPPSAWAPPPPVAVTAAPPPAPIAVTAAPPPAPIAAPLAAFLASQTDEPGARAVEVAAMLGDSVVEVKHCMDPRGGKVTRATYALLGASLVCLATAGASFVSGVRVAARNADGLAYWTHVLHKPAHAFRPEHASGALDVLQLLGLSLGIGTAAAGLSRARRERKSPYFRIGTAAGVECATESAPAASFPLVAPSGDDFVFHFAPGIDGEMIAAGATTPLAELAASGRARPSPTVPGAFELPIPAAAKIRARAGATTFLISAVARPRAQALPAFVLDGRAATYAAASLVAHLGLYGLSSLGTADAATIGLDTDVHEDTYIRTNTTDNEQTPDKPDPATASADTDSGHDGGRMALPEGAAGKPTSDRPDGQMQIKDNHLEQPQIARADALAYARQSGILGDAPALQNAISSLAGTADLSNGLDTDNVYGPLFGASGEGHGNFGMGRTGSGFGGGCTETSCVGVGISSGNYNTIGNGHGAGTGWHIGTGTGVGDGVRHPLIPTVNIAPPTAIGDLDKSIIKRYVNRQREKIAYCYESQLLAHPGIAGDVTVQFFIAPDGSVRTANGAGFNPDVASCVADIVHHISFPAPRDGGGVQVNYPFHFHMAAGQ